MNQESQDEGTENVEEQVTEEMKKALDSNGFIGSTIDLVTGAAMAVMKGEVFEGASGELTEEDKLKSAEKKRRLRELMDPGAAPHIRAETRAEKEVEQTQFIGRKWREEGPKGPGYYLSYVAVAGQLCLNRLALEACASLAKSNACSSVLGRPGANPARKQASATPAVRLRS